jgi:hypothetical protein
MRDNVDTAAQDEPTVRVEPGTDAAHGEAPPSRPGRAGTPAAPPPPGLVALATPAHADTASRRRADPPAATAAQPATGYASGEPAPDPATTPNAAALPSAETGEAAEPLPDPVSDNPAARAEPAHASEREHPAWLGEPTGHFDLDLPEPGRTNPSWLGEPTGRPDHDTPFDQHAVPAGPMPSPSVRAAETPVSGAYPAMPDDAAQDPVAAEAARPGHALPDDVNATTADATVVLPAAHHSAAAAPPTAYLPAASAPTEAFTMPVHEVPKEGWIDPRLHGGARRARPEAGPARKRAKRPRTPRRTGVAMPLLILFGLVATFFSWVSAEPLWLAAGHGRAGTLTVTSCDGSGLWQRCVGEFATPTRDFTAVSVNVLGPPGQAEGLSAPARMVGANSHRAYVTSGTGGLHLRWIIGLAMVLLCSIAIVFATGALRLPERRERLAAVGLSFAGPLLITIGFLAATF